jgi:hypothetical protein
MNNNEEVSQYLQHADLNKRNSVVPRPPRPGEIIICQHCGQPMLPKDFSKDPEIRKQEFKWHIHDKCKQELLNLVDRATPGLIAERTRKN